MKDLNEYQGKLLYYACILIIFFGYLGWMKLRMHLGI